MNGQQKTYLDEQGNPIPSPSKVYLNEQGQPLTQAGARGPTPGEMVQQMQAPKTPPRPPGFWGGVAEMAKPWEQVSDIWQGPAYAVRHPLDSAALLGRGMWEAQKGQAQKAWQAVKTMQPQKAIMHGAAALVPGVGPAVATAVERMEDPEQRARGAGNLVGIAAPSVVLGGLGRVRPAKPTGVVPLLRSERTGGTLPRFVENIAERTIPGGKRMETFRATQQDALINRAAEGVVASISRHPLTKDPVQLGQLVQKEWEAGKKAAVAAARQQYEAIDAATQSVGLQAQTAGLKAFVTPLAERLRYEATIMPKAELARYESVLTAIQKAPDQLPFSAFQDMRSDLLKIVRSFDEPIPGKTGGLAKRLAAVTDDAMMEAARKSGIPNLEADIRAANAAWRKAESQFNEGVAKRLLEVSPEKVPQALKSLPIEDLAMMKATVSPQTWAALKGQFARQLIGEAVQGELGAHMAGAQVVPGMTQAIGAPITPMRLRGNILRSQLESLGVRGTAIFGRQEMSELIALANLAEQVGRRSSGYVPGLIAGGMNAYMLVGAPTIALATGDVTALVGAAGMAASLNAITRLITKPQGITQLRQFVHAIGDRNVVRANFWGTQIQNSLAAPEKPIAQPYQGDKNR